MNVKISTILPIILALILPFFRFFLKGDEYGDISWIGVWLLLSIVLYLLWYFLWWLWDIRTDTKRIWQALGLLLLVVILMSINQRLLENNTNTLQKITIARLIASAILYLSIQYAIKSQENVSRLLLEKEQLQTEHYKTQLQVLRSKIDPHFLFNTLNTLRIMVRNKHEGAEKFVMSLSDFYRQTLQFNEHSTISLGEEMEVLEAYLFLMKNRNQAGLTIQVEIERSLYQRFIPTLALQVVTENCFKHNAMSVTEPLHISIKSTDNAYIAIRNNVQPKLTMSEPSGHGLENVLKRYELLGVENGVQIQQTADFFEVQLKLIQTTT